MFLVVFFAPNSFDFCSKLSFLKVLVLTRCRREPEPNRSPAGFHHSGDFPLECQFPKADTTHPKIPHESPGSSTTMAAISLSHGEFRFPLGLLKKRLPSQTISLDSDPDFIFLMHPSKLKLLKLSVFLIRFYLLNGIPRFFKSSNPSSSVLAVVAMVTFIPLIFSTLS